jgi:hypothetical protein
MRLITHLFILSLLPILFTAYAGSARSPKIATSSGPFSSIKASEDQSSNSAAGSANASRTCAVTIPNRSTPPGEPPSSNHHGNDGLWTVLWPKGTVVFKQGDPSSVEVDGALAMKFPWWRGVKGKLTVEGRRLDGSAPPLRARVPEGYGDTGFQSTALIFPTEGCWEVTGRVGDTSLTFVTRVVKTVGHK